MWRRDLTRSCHEDYLFDLSSAFAGVFVSMCAATTTVPLRAPGMMNSEESTDILQVALNGTILRVMLLASIRA